MEASGEIRLSSTTMRRMPVLAQSGALNDPDFFTSQEGASGTVYESNYRPMNDSLPALSQSYFSVAEFADALSGAASFATSILASGNRRLVPPQNSYMALAKLVWDSERSRTLYL
jgi:hypothetical protein